MPEPTRYPLAWPFGWKRYAGARDGGRFKRPMGAALDLLLAELGRLGASDVIISTNIEARIDGRPYADPRRVTDPGVAVYFKLKKAPRVLACDRWATVEANINAIALHVEAIRAQERWGVGTLDQAFAGYAALPATTGGGWREVLRFGSEPITLEQVKERYRSAVKLCHPDLGGNADEMARINQAMEEAERELAVR